MNEEGQLDKFLGLIIVFAIKFKMGFDFLRYYQPYKLQEKLYPPPSLSSDC